MRDSRDLETEILACLAQNHVSDTAFENLALHLFQYQFHHNSAYQNYCVALGITPENLRHWSHIPALPTDAFKYPDTPVVSFPIDAKQHTFLTSGTTSEKHGAHHFPSLKLYEASIRKSWEPLGISDMPCGIFLTPPPSQAPHSSLSHMMGTLEPIIANASIWMLQPNNTLDIHSLKERATSGKPIALLGTALSFLHLFDHLDEPLHLPKGSIAMETGGYKGTHRHMEKHQLYALFEEKLGLPAQAIVNEYSMTELSSQFYTKGLDQSHKGPPWTRIRVIDPRTGQDAEQNEPGYLVIYDLANLHSVMAIQTQDIAIAHDNRSFTLLGRDPSALPRGCSRAADSHLSS